MSRVVPALVLLSCLSLACSDDSQPPGDQGLSRDVKKPGDGTQVGAEARPGDSGGVVADVRVPDQAIWKCTAGAANMCDGFKTQYCLNGVCTACPANMTDCDRKGDCECAGVCDGTKCKTP